MANDIKFQVWRGNTPIDHHDFRGEGLRKSPDDEHRTFAEIPKADEGLVDVLFNPEKLAEFIRPGDSVASIVNRALAEFTAKQPSTFGLAAGLLGLGGSGKINASIRLYDAD